MGHPLVSCSSAHSWGARRAGFPTNSKASGKHYRCSELTCLYVGSLAQHSATTQSWLRLGCVQHVCLCCQAAHPCSSRRGDILGHMSSVSIPVEKLLCACCQPSAPATLQCKTCLYSAIFALCNPSCCCCCCCSWLSSEWRGNEL